MALDFNGTSQYLRRTSAILTVEPLTMAAWVNLDDNTNAQPIMSISHDAISGLFWELQAGGATAGDPIRAAAYKESGSAAVANSTTGYSLSTWHHACAVFASSTSRAAYIDGGSKGTNTTSNTMPGTANMTCIAALSQGGIVRYLNGRVAEAAIWDVALGDDEVAILAKGFSPLLVRPGNLVAYWPIMLDLSHGIDLINDYYLTPQNTPVKAVHPRILHHSIRSILLPPSVAEATRYGPRAQIFRAEIPYSQLGL